MGGGGELISIQFLLVWGGGGELQSIEFLCIWEVVESSNLLNSYVYGRWWRAHIVNSYWYGRWWRSHIVYSFVYRGGGDLI